MNVFNFCKNTKSKILLIIPWFLKEPKFLNKNKKVEEPKIKDIGSSI
jgi:hypothetical protein